MKKSQNEKFKIAMIGHKRIPSREGGVEVVVEELSKRYAKWGYNVTVFNRAGHHISGKKYDNTNCTSKYKEINVVKVPTIKIKGMAAVSSSFFATISAIFMRFDVIHYHAEGPCVMIFLAHLFKIHTVATIHGLDWKRAKWSGLAKNYIKLGEKIAAKYADQVIVLSESMKSYFKNNYNRDTIYLPNGIAKVQKKEVDIINKNWDLYN